MIRPGTLSAIVLTALIPLSQATVAAADKTPPKPDVTFNHSDGTSKIYVLDLSDGQKFTVAITNTCPDAFDYSYAGVARGSTDTGQSVAPTKELETKTIEVVYDQRFGGYVFTIAAKDIKATDVCKGAEKLGPASFIVSVRHETFNLSFSGGFTVSGLTNPVYALKTANGVKQIVSEPDKEDKRKLGAASFVHLFHDGVSAKGLQPALAFGLGINGDNRTEYLVGAGLRFGDRATFNVGRVWGSIARLPNGVGGDVPVTDDNILNNLGSQVVGRWFVALSYSFIDTKDRLLKPFAQESAAPAPGAPAAAAKNAAATSDEVQTAAKDPKTYEAAALIKPLFAADGQAKLEICDASTTAVGDKTDVTVSIRAATAAQLGILNGQSAAASTAIAAALAPKKKTVNLGTIAFKTDATKCKP